MILLCKFNVCFSLILVELLRLRCATILLLGRAAHVVSDVATGRGAYFRGCRSFPVLLLVGH